MKKILIFLLLFIVTLFTVSCKKTEAIEISQLVFDIITYIFTAVISYFTSSKITSYRVRKKISDDDTNNYKMK